MIEHIWTIPCRLSTTDRETNNVSLIEVLEEVVVSAGPPAGDLTQGLVPAVFDIVTLWARGEEGQPIKGYGRLSLVSPAGATCFEHEYEIDLEKHERTRTIGRAFGLPVEQAGRHYFKVESRPTRDVPWKEEYRIPITVRIVPAGAAFRGNGGTAARP
jgi:hypothetical protein